MQKRKPPVLIYQEINNPTLLIEGGQAHNVEINYSVV